MLKKHRNERNEVKRKRKEVQAYTTLSNKETKKDGIFKVFQILSLRQPIARIDCKYVIYEEE